MKKFALILGLLLGWLPAHATVISQGTSVSYTCTGTVGPFAFTFSASAPNSITVTQNNVVLATTAYTVRPVNNNYDNGGSVTLNTACPAAQPLVITRTTPLTQTSVFSNNSPANQKAIEDGLDKLTEIAQELGTHGGGTGGVSSVGVATAGGLTGTVLNPNTTPVISMGPDSTHIIPINTGVGDGWLNNAGRYTVPPSGGGGPPTGAAGGSLAGTYPNPSLAVRALPNGMTATTQTVGDGTAKVATDAFVLANAGGGGLSGQTPTCAPKAATGTTSTSSLPICDDGTTTTFTHPGAFNTTGPSQWGFTYNSTPLVPGSATTAVMGANASGQGVMSEAGGPAARICDATNGVCGGGGTSNPATCTANGTTDLCVTLAPYYASGAGATTTTTSATFGVGTSGSVASCSTFSANNGVLITGAGAAGVNYIGTVVSCSGTTLTITPATSTSVASGVVVQHDETAAFQAAITALAATGGNIYIPSGTYLLNGPLQDTGGANAVLTMPHLAIGASTTTTFIGFQEPASLANATPPAGTVLITAQNSGSLFGGFCSTCGGLNFTFAGIQMENLILLGPPNPSITMVNAFWIATAKFYHLAVGTTGGSGLPTSTTGAGLVYPAAGNDVRLSGADLYVSGFGTCVQTGEHTTITELGESNCIKGLVPQSRPSTPYAGNVQHIVHFWCQECTYQLAAGANVASIKIDTMDIETAGTNGIYDPSNLMFGDIGFNVQAASGAVTPTNPAVNGASNLCIHNIQFPNGTTYGGACPAGGGGGFPITLGSTSIASVSTTTALSGLTLNGVNIGFNGGTLANDTINFGGNYGADAIDLYASGSDKYYWGLNAGEMQFGVQDNTTTHFSFNAAAGGLQSSGSNEYARLTPRTSGGGWTIAGGQGYCWSNSTTSSVTADTCMWRDSAGVFDFGNATPGNTGGTVKAATYGAGTLGSGMIATTQASSDSSTKVATTAYVKNFTVRDFGTTFGDTAGSALTSGSVVYFTVPYACTIAGWNMSVDAGTATIDVWKIATGTAVPTVTNTITASALPAIATGTSIHSTTLTGWTTAVSANDIFGLQLKTVATAKFVEVDLQCNQ